jgi:bifunctional UDP-N-acetylglucosamine pyrophosphorylase/glucosamine-1-phosphate N-acetyltransferase
MKNVQIIILAAGHGKRMQAEMPKVLVPLRGIPLIAHVLHSVKASGVEKKPIIVVGQRRELVMQTLGDAYTYVIQEEQKGTGHAVMSTHRNLKDDIEHVVVLYGDHPFISGETIKKLIEKHLNTQAKITMATVVLPNFEDWYKVFYTSFSRIVRDKNGSMVKDVQFRDATEEEKKITEVNPCYFCFEKNWLFKNLKKLNTDNVQKEYYLTDLVKIAMQEDAKIESINITPHEALGVNSKAELEVLEKLAI